ncbi:MAG: MBOAT family protein [Clostridia bacterium]|nr:MBOAT family protein [Clostridia bacterium]
MINFVFYAFASGEFFWVLPLLSLVTYALSFLKPGVGFGIMLILLPLTRLCGISAAGVSFFILRAAAYLYDGHRERSCIRLCAFLLFFPCVSAGPLTRWEQMQGGFGKLVNYRLMERGIFLSLFGIVKKLFFSDALYEAFLQFHAGGTSLSAVAALVCYALYIYFDFSGYSDLAIGISAVFGFDLPKNFDHPYMSHSVGEFFRRWHISLGAWLRDYVYIPLGGSRKGKGRMLLSLGAVWLTSALWHGSALSYLLWGGWFFCLIAAEKLFLPKGMRLGHLTTLALVLIGWVFFFSGTPAAALAFFKRLLCLGGTLLYCRADLYHCVRLAPFVCLAVFCATPLLHDTLASLYRRKKVLLYPLAVAAFVLVLSCLAVGAHHPFLYASF